VKQDLGKQLIVWPKGNNSRRNYLRNILNDLLWETTWYHIWLRPSFDGLYRKVYFWCWSEIQDDSHSSTFVLQWWTSRIFDRQHKIVWGPGHVINIYPVYRKVDILKFTMFRPIQVPILTSFVLFGLMVSEKNIGNWNKRQQIMDAIPPLNFSG